MLRINLLGERMRVKWNRENERGLIEEHARNEGASERRKRGGGGRGGENVLARSFSGQVWVMQGPKLLAKAALLHRQAASPTLHSPKARAVIVQLS